MVTLQSLLRDKAFYRDVAQLVAHYVRHVGVGRSSRLIPTDTKHGIIGLFFYPCIPCFSYIALSALQTNTEIASL